MLYSALADGSKIPVIGLGSYASEKSKIKEAYKHAISVGYRHFDCAFIYGNQKEIGEAFKEIFASGTVKREDLWITSKVFNTDHAPDRVEKACHQTLSDLQISYLDEYLIHWPISEGGKPVTISETWKAMESLKQKGLVKHIGVSNFNVQLLNEIYNGAQIYKPELNQVELHPYLQQTRLVEFCMKIGVHITAYCPLVKMGVGSTIDPTKDPVLQKIAQKHSKTIAQVLLRWNFQRYPNVSVVPKTTSLERITENYGALSFNLDDADMSEIKKLERNYRIVDALEQLGIPLFD
ncbi:MAG: aldehyde reductase [Streblomastix strix]|uniref:Aldehyde reductase n=1 Tax=Streblomastix strix TaxID=222440 RepID=A0A5J4WYF5_9EUKA|nr:MAG: aldehyde reductase [Streblomastix strix]